MLLMFAVTGCGTQTKTNTLTNDVTVTKTVTAPGEADGDGDGYPASVDCDDTNSDIHPNASDQPGNGVDEDCDGSDDAEALVDLDGDGVVEPQDCDDGDSTIYPGAPEVVGDGIDQDCDGSDLLPNGTDDQDGDGVTAPADCDDLNQGVYPGAPEIAGDGIDQDCDGVDTSAIGQLAPGDLVITEVMNEPAAEIDDYGEWFEIKNQTSLPVDLEGLLVTPSNALLAFTVGESVTVAPQGYALFARDSDPAVNGLSATDVTFDYRSDFNLDNDQGELTLSDPTTLVVFDDLTWDKWNGYPKSAGHSLAKDPRHLDATGPDEGQFWCSPSVKYNDPTGPADDYGTPGAANPNCPGMADSDGDGWYTPADCDDGDAGIHPGASDTAYDGVDQDCDTADAHTSDLKSGDLVINEIMNNSLAVGDSNGEWFEIFNPGNSPINLDGLTVESDTAYGTESFAVDHLAVIGSKSYTVFAINNNTATNGGVDSAVISYDWPGSQLGLSNGTDAIRLKNGGTLVDQVAWDNGVTFPDVEGASMCLSGSARTATANDSGTNWHATTADHIAGDPTNDFGTPGAANGACQ